MFHTSKRVRVARFGGWARPLPSCLAADIAVLHVLRVFFGVLQASSYDQSELLVLDDSSNAGNFMFE